MKKMLIVLVAGVLLASCICVPVSNAAEGERGGLMGFVAGCCFGIRAGGDYNSGKEIHWREWLRIVPIVSLVVGIWDGIECAEGKTTADFAKQYGSMYY